MMDATLNGFDAGLLTYTEHLHPTPLVLQAPPSSAGNPFLVCTLIIEYVTYRT